MTKLLVLSALTAISLKAMVQGFQTFSRTSLSMTKRLDNEMESERLMFHLRKYLSGVRGFETLSFRIPDAYFMGVPAQSAGAGFYVRPLASINGGALPDSDQLTVLVHEPVTGTPLTLATDIQPGSTSFEVEPNTSFTEGDVLVLSDTQSAEALLISNLSSTSVVVGAKRRFNLNSNWLKSIYNPHTTPTRIRNFYAVGDPVYRAKIVQVGIDPLTQCLVVKERGSKVFQNCKVKSFQAFYKIDDKFEREDWKVLNKGDYQGYKNIKEVKFEIVYNNLRKSWTTPTNQ